MVRGNRNFSISLKFSEFCAGLPLHKAVFRKFAVEFRKEKLRILLYAELYVFEQ
jgi:hypothetical protein